MLFCAMAHGATIRVGDNGIEVTPVASEALIPQKSLRLIDSSGNLFYAQALKAAQPCTGDTWDISGISANCTPCPAGSVGALPNAENGGNTGCACDEGTWENGICKVQPGGTGCVAHFDSAADCLDTPVDSAASATALQINSGTKMCHCYEMGGFFVDTETNTMRCGCPGFYWPGCDTSRYTSCGTGDTGQGGIPYL